MPRPTKGQVYVPARHEMETYSGVYFNLLNPDPKDVDIRDIATALSRICRYTGHPTKPYSVAEHLVRASYVPLEGQYSEVTAHRIRLAILLHDAHEAYTGDISSPMKMAMRALSDRDPRMRGKYAHFDDIERRCEDAVAVRLGQWFEFSSRMLVKARAEVHRADMIMLKTEAQVMMKSEGQGWSLDKWPTHRSGSMATTYGWPWRKARAKFLRRFKELKGMIG